MNWAGLTIYGGLFVIACMTAPWGLVVLAVVTCVFLWE